MGLSQIIGEIMVRIAVISTVKSPLSELILFVNYHLNIGVDKIILFFDDPLDEGIEILSQYKNVCVFICSNEYWYEKTGSTRPISLDERLVINVNEGAKTAENMGCNWILQIDSDELVSQMISLKHIDGSEALKAIGFIKHPYAQVQLFERINSILVTDTQANINRMVEIIGYIDQPLESREEPNIVLIKYAKAKGMIDMYFNTNGMLLTESKRARVC